MKKFNENLSNFRRKKELTQQQLAFVSGLSISQIQKYEGGRGQPNLNSLIALAKALNTTTDELLGYTEIKEKEA